MSMCWPGTNRNGSRHPQQKLLTVGARDSMAATVAVCQTSFGVGIISDAMRSRDSGIRYMKSDNVKHRDHRESTENTERIRYVLSEPGRFSLWSLDFVFSVFSVFQHLVCS